MSSKRQFMKNAALAVIPALASTRLMAQSDNNATTRILAVIFAEVKKLQRYASKDGTPGLYCPGKAPGDVSGRPIEAGYIGQIIDETKVVSTSAHNALPSIVLPRGVWQVSVFAQTDLGENTVPVVNYSSVEYVFEGSGVLNETLPFFSTTATLNNPNLAATVATNHGCVPVVADGSKALTIHVFSSQPSFTVTCKFRAIRVA